MRADALSRPALRPASSQRYTAPSPNWCKQAWCGKQSRPVKGRRCSDSEAAPAISSLSPKPSIAVQWSSAFRGGWCPFCRLELRALADAQSEIERLGARLIGLSPLPDGDSHSSFLILQDPGCRIAARYRIAFIVARQFRRAYLALGYPERLKKGPKRWVLPLPATYIIDRDGIVMLSYVDADYTTRLGPTDIAVALSHLRLRANPSSSVC